MPAPYFQRAMLWQWPLSLIMLIGFAPIMVLIALLIRITSPGPAIYRQTRLGRDGKPFTLYKFRSMHLDAESKTGAVWAKPGDPRVTLLGKITRNLHLDELPQLFNVIRGEMALVGPRPERPEFTTKIVEEVPEFPQRLCIRPGITGLAQVHQGPDVDMDSVRRKLVYDLEYVDCASTWLDWRIMVCTLLRATEKSRLWGIRFFRLPSPSLDHLPTRKAKVATSKQAVQSDLSAAGAASERDAEINGRAASKNPLQDGVAIGENGHEVNASLDDADNADRADVAHSGKAANSAGEENGSHSNGVSKSSHSVAPVQ